MSAAVALVTGAASGIGEACVARLLDDGWRVAAVDIDAGRVDELARRDGVVGIVADVADERSVADAVRDAQERCGPIAALANVAGITGPRAATSCHETSPADWDRVFAVNVRGPFLLCRCVLPRMLEAGAGVIVNVASVAGLVAFPARCAYSASKGAVLTFTRSLAADYAGRGIRANAVCPGMIDTPMTRWRLQDPVLGPAVVARVPQGRVGSAAEVADVVGFLVSDESRYVNGSAVVVDGGWTAV